MKRSVPVAVRLVQVAPRPYELLDDILVPAATGLVEGIIFVDHVTVRIGFFVKEEATYRGLVDLYGPI